MAPVLPLAFLLTLLEALLLFLFTLLTNVSLSLLGERLALFGKRLLRLSGKAALLQLAGGLALTALGVSSRLHRDLGRQFFMESIIVACITGVVTLVGVHHSEFVDAGNIRIRPPAISSKSASMSSAC